MELGVRLAHGDVVGGVSKALDDGLTKAMSVHDLEKQDAFRMFRDFIGSLTIKQ